MSWLGKVIGMVLGGLVGGLFGSVLGFILGSLFDSMMSGRRAHWSDSIRGSATSGSFKKFTGQGIFFNTTFRVMGYIAKSDGQVSEMEIQQARLIMHKMGLDDRLKRESIDLFNEGKQPHFNLREAIGIFKQACRFQPALLQTFWEIQLQIAGADGKGISVSKQAILQQMARQLGMSAAYSFENHFQNRAYGWDDTSNHHHQASHSSQQDDVQAAYYLLNVTASSTLDDIKKAYRRLISQYHPDKLIAKGVSADRIKVANQKTQEIKQAYETICKARQVFESHS